MAHHSKVMSSEISPTNLASKTGGSEEYTMLAKSQRRGWEIHAQSWKSYQKTSSRREKNNLKQEMFYISKNSKLSGNTP